MLLQEAATIRASMDLAADDKGDLEMPWTDMDQSVAAFSSMKKRQVRHIFRTLSVTIAYSFLADALSYPSSDCVQGLPLSAHGDAGDVRAAAAAEGLPAGEAKHVRNSSVSV